MTKFEETAPLFMGRLMDDFDLTHEDAAAIVGNAAHECEGFEDLTEDKPLIPGSRGGYGWMQWTGPRRRQFEAWLKRKGWKGPEFEANYSFLFRELLGPEGRVLPAVKAADGLEAKTEVFMSMFLRPGIPHLQGRIHYAKKCMKMEPVRTADPAPVDAQAEPKPGVVKANEMLNFLIGNLLRHGLTTAAGFLVAKGMLAPGMEGAFMEVGGGIGAGLAGLAMSYLNSASAKAKGK